MIIKKETTIIRMRSIMNHNRPKAASSYKNKIILKK